MVNNFRTIPPHHRLCVGLLLSDLAHQRDRHIMCTRNFGKHIMPWVKRATQKKLIDGRVTRAGRQNCLVGTKLTQHGKDVLTVCKAVLTSRD